MKTPYTKLAVLAALTACCALGCSKPKDNGAKADEPGAAKTPDADKAKSGDEFVAGSKADMFTMALAADPETFDTAKMSGAPEGRIAFNLFEGLYMPGPSTEKADTLVVPGAASGHTLSEDGKTYTFTIRDGAQWSNGRQVTAEDFVYSWKRILTPGFEADYVTFLYLIEGAEAFNKEKGEWEAVGIKATDEKTLEVKLNAPTPYFLELVAFYTFFPVPKEAIEAHGDDWTKPGKIVTNGPYELATYEPQKELMLKRSEKYWGKDEVKLAEAKLRIIPDGKARVNAYQAGELHWVGAGLPVAEIQGLLTHPDYKTEPLLGVYYYRVNVQDKNSPLANPKVRKALAMAVDRDVLVDEILSGLYEKANSYVPTSMPGHTPGGSVETNPAKAKKVLAEALGEGGKLGTIELLYNTDENHKLVAEAIQRQWKEGLGIEVSLVNKEWKSYLKDVDTLSYQVARAGWIGDYNDPMTFLEMWTTDDGNNDTGWSDAEYDELITQARASTDAAARAAILTKAEGVLLERGPVIPIYFYTTNTLVARQLTGFEPHNRDVHLLKYLSLGGS